MKKILRIYLLAAALLVTSVIIRAQEPPHPNLGNAPNQGGTVNGPVGGGAPIGGGLSILITLGISLGIRRLTDGRQSIVDDIT